MDEPILIALSAGYLPYWSNEQRGYAMLWIKPAATAPLRPYGEKNQPHMLWALVLDRKDPTKPAIFNGILPNNTDVPAMLKSSLTDNSLFFFVAAGPGTNLPQGALCDLLKVHGAGGQLERYERLSTQFGSGISFDCVYVLASVPGSGTPGFENVALGGRVYSEGSQGSVAPRQYLLLDLLPTAQGYVPVQVG